MGGFGGGSDAGFSACAGRGGGTERGGAEGDCEEDGGVVFAGVGLDSADRAREGDDAEADGVERAGLG